MILLDTHIWIRWLLPTDPLPPTLIEQIEQADAVCISSISCWEATMLEKKQRIVLPLPIKDWLEEATQGSNVDVLPITCDISQLSGTLPEHHKDPADRIIIATSIIHDLQLMSLDGYFPDYQELSGRLITR
jgi:PIN domain nuclease of toxin-antitoxin system